ncbi:hypothetical protein CNMCM5623_006869 [Aspergillus felis]|uniref:Uncharacterized protein n=1 Tax=Aspergillus felis TaxID=1287682 RepID=A0A8H6QLG4_9EURO|nr:hypothetical protein CNMCM5623_006869 [Aspergillus felis]KAF7176056.1 hypothetical protein CNMCM7691_001231 [Aspergillus felis]
MINPIISPIIKMCQRSLLSRVTIPEGHPHAAQTEQTEQTEKTGEPSAATSSGPSGGAPPGQGTPRLNKLKEEWKKEFLQELRDGHWVVPEDEEVVGPGQGPDPTPGQVLRKNELLEVLEERKAVKDACLQEKRELQDMIRGLEVRLKNADQAFHNAKADVLETVRKLNSL